MSSSSDDTVISMDEVEVHFEENSGLLGMFSDPDTVHAVDGVSIDVPENDILALVGESGCGKTTLGKTAIGMQRPTSGSVQFRGQDIWKAKDGEGSVDIPYDDIRRALQIIHQDPGSALNPYRKVRNNLAEPLKHHYKDLSKEDRTTRILNMLEAVGMTPPTDYASRYPHQLSGGEKQRIALIRALMMNPDLILADESVSALDVSLRVEMMDLMIELQNQFNTSILFISHDLSNARYITSKADGRIGIMYLGKLVEIGPPEQILNNPQHPYTKALRWSSPDLGVTSSDGELPMRKIDIPDPINPPSGCRFHTRCPVAREACTKTLPETTEVEGDHGHEAACFRVQDDHEYWDSASLEDTDDEETYAERFAD
ncbi:ABC transporter ATP-binding protein [Halorussus salinisoli]|uniref:ABC transporter ATP-binding protein n=1 Tax=Halorussus salinisoli TaxID=2558242 RepID=UPI0010C1F9E8|nr:ABC transporter ATP-binding protein [Halorussus salinisoli]